MSEKRLGKAERELTVNELVRSREKEGVRDTEWILCEDESGIQTAIRLQHGRIETVRYREAAGSGDEVLAIDVEKLGVVRYEKVIIDWRTGKWRCGEMTIEMDGRVISNNNGETNLTISVPSEEGRLEYQISPIFRGFRGHFFDNAAEGISGDHYLPVVSNVILSPIDV